MGKTKTTSFELSETIELEKSKIIDLWFSGGAGAAGELKIYDGHNTTGQLRLHLLVLGGTTFHLNPREPLLFQNGVFIQRETLIIGGLILTERITEE